MNDEGLYTNTINDLLVSDDYTRSISEGTFACDELKNIVIGDFPRCIVVNLDRSDQPGSHWVGLYFVSPSEVEFFDSYGRELKKYSDIDLFVRSNVRGKKSIIENRCILQGDDTNVCGQWTVQFLWLRSRGLILEDFLSIFDDRKSGYYDNYINESVIIQYCKNSGCAALFVIPDSSNSQNCLCKFQVCCADLQ